MQGIELGGTGVFGAMILVGAVQGASLAGVFWLRSRGDRVANRLLAVLVLLITLHLSELFLDITQLLARVPFLSGATFPLIFLIGPTFLLYVRRLVGPELRPRPVWLLHAVPFACCVALVWPWYFTPSEIKATYHAGKQWGGHTPIDLKTYLLLFLNVLQNFGYAFVAERLLKAREGDLARLSSDNAVLRSLASLRRIARAFSLYAAGYFFVFLALLIWNQYTAEVDTVWLICIAGFWQVLGFSAIDQPETFAHVRWLPAQARRESPDEESARPKYAKAALSPDRSRELMEGVRELMERDRLYRNGGLKLSDVARALRASLHHVSQAINRESDSTFLELVNRYRVEEAQRLLADPEMANLTVLAIGFEAGFNNKASFNQAFKKYTGRTPSAYRRNPSPAQSRAAP